MATWPIQRFASVSNTCEGAGSYFPISSGLTSREGTGAGGPPNRAPRHPGQHRRRASVGPLDNSLISARGQPTWSRGKSAQTGGVLGSGEGNERAR